MLLVALGISVCWPLFKAGYFSHQDDLQIMRIFEMRKCMTDLQIPCRWVPDMGWGNGIPLFNYYGVFTYYLGAILSFVVGYIASAKILFFLALTAGGIGMYFLVEELWGRSSGAVAGILYTLAPYKALDIYVRGALAESLALAIIPFVFYFGYKLIKDNKRSNFVGFSLTLFLFAITHNIMTLLFIPFLVFWLFYWLAVSKWKNLKILILSLLTGFALSAFFVIPAFFEKNLIQTESLTRFELDFRANYLKLSQLFIDRVWGFGTSIPGVLGKMSFQIGWPHWWLVLATLIFLLVFKLKKNIRVLAVGIAAAFLFSIFMTHNKSTFIWENIGILRYFQFPWRFLSLSIFSASLIGGFLIFILKENWRLYMALIIIGLSTVLNWSYFRPMQFYDINDSQKLSGEVWEQQQKGALLDYLPKSALEPREGGNLPIVKSGIAKVTQFNNHSNSWNFKVNVIDTALIEVPVYYFPNWVVKVNSKDYPYSYKNYTGRISVTLPAGEYSVEGRFVSTPLRKVANTISLVGLVGFVVFCIYAKNKKIFS